MQELTLVLICLGEVRWRSKFVIVDLLRQSEAVSKIIRRLGWARALDIIRDIEPYLHQTDLILDIGCGICCVTELLKSHGFKVIPLDSKNISVARGITPVLFEGRTLPFKANTFDIALLLNVLHHVEEPEAILREAKR
ncbi:class I SAM-dependent methyltransferase, partial [bacterium]